MSIKAKLTTVVFVGLWAWLYGCQTRETSKGSHTEGRDIGTVDAGADKYADAVTDSDIGTDSNADIDYDANTDIENYAVQLIEIKPSRLSAGGEHTCAVTDNGFLMCWGSNRAAQSGGADWIRFPAGIVEEFGDQNVSVSAGSGYTCTLTKAGGAMCMGMNWAGQLGTSKQCPRSDDDNCIFDFPVIPVGLGTGVMSVHTGGMATHTCAILESGEVVCFGKNWSGETGQACDGECYQDETPVPKPVVGLGARAVYIGAGSLHTCALLEIGKVMCWGLQADGRLGNPFVPDGVSATPVEVQGLKPGAIALAVGEYHSCVIRADNAVLCWGRCDFGGNCGSDRDSRIAERPVRVDGIPGTPIDIAAGSGFTCVLNKEGEVYCFGSRGASATPESVGDEYGQIVLPHRIAGLPSDIVEITAGYRHACALSSDDRVYCWGNSSKGQLGVMPIFQAFGVPELEEGVTKVGLGARQVCGLLPEGIVRCFAFPWNSTASITEYDLGAADLAVGREHVCILDAAGILKCWGDNKSSQLGAEGDYFS